MNEASAGLLALAQKLAPYYRANPKVAAVAVEGSAARGYADRFSDLDLAVFWSFAPTGQERREIIEHAGGRHAELVASHGEVVCWSDTYEVDGFAIDVRHVDVQTTRRILAEVLERSDPSLSKQRHLATLLSALPLADSSAVLTDWQSRAQDYPRALSIAMVSAHLRFPPAWEQEQLAERGEQLALYESFCIAQKRMLLVLLGLNRLYYPGWLWVDQLIEQMRIAPLKLAPRCKQVFGIVCIDPLASVYQLHDLIEETFRLVQTQLGELDTSQARARFQERRRVWERVSDRLLEEKPEKQGGCTYRDL
jgi:predicted nucleotidyltransferase